MEASQAKQNVVAIMFKLNFLPYILTTFLMFTLSSCIALPTGLSSTGKTKIQVPTLNETPILIGIASGAGREFSGAWQINELTIDTKGKIFGNIKINYDKAVTLSSPILADILFVQLDNVYVHPLYGDSTTQSLDFLPFMATETTNRSATYIIDGHLPLPELMLNVDGGMPLQIMELRLIWYRVFSATSSGCGYYAVEVVADMEMGDFTQTRLGDMVKSKSGKIGEYTMGGDEPGKYCKWLQSHLSAFIPQSPLHTPNMD